MIRKFSFCVVAGLLFSGMYAQESALQFHVKFDKEKLEPAKKYVSANNDTLQIDMFRLYVSDIQIQYSDASIDKPQKQYHLIDMEDVASLRLPITTSKKTISKIIFNIGIDSTASVSGALGGDLDPTKGMYWAWQSGYINVKMEGKSPSCKTRKHEFQFHVGGYLKPNYAMRTVELNTSNTNITIDIAELFSKVKLAETNSIMIPGKPAMAIADWSATMFKTE
jgi:hypothetical protein